MADLPTGTVTFLFTDIEGSTRLWEQHPQAMAGALARHDAIMRQAIAAEGGVVFKVIGDAFQAAFTTAPAACAAALAAQRALAAEAWGAIGALPVRMALHTGAALRDRWRLPHRRAQPPRAPAGRGPRRPDPALAQHRGAGARHAAARCDAARPGRAPAARSAPRADLPAGRARPARRLPAAQDARPPTAQPAGAANRADRARARGRGGLRLAAARRRAAGDADWPGRHRQDPPGAPGRGRAARRVRRWRLVRRSGADQRPGAGRSRRSRRTLGVQGGGGEPLGRALQDLPARQAAAAAAGQLRAGARRRAAGRASCWRPRRG